MPFETILLPLSTPTISKVALGNSSSGPTLGSGISISFATTAISLFPNCSEKVSAIEEQNGQANELTVEDNMIANTNRQTPARYAERTRELERKSVTTRPMKDGFDLDLFVGLTFKEFAFAD